MLCACSQSPVRSNVVSEFVRCVIILMYALD